MLIPTPLHFSENLPVVCGGLANPTRFHCYRYTFQTNTWHLVGTLPAARGYPGRKLFYLEAKAPFICSFLFKGYSHLPSIGLIATAGASDSLAALNTTISTLDGVSFTSDFERLPVSLYAPCQVSVGGNVIMVFGGSVNNAQASKRAFQLDIR